MKAYADSAAGMEPVRKTEPGFAPGRRYLYAVIRAQDALPASCTGIDNLGIHKIEEGDIAAIASTVPSARIRPERRHLAAHQEVLKQLLLLSATPMPMTFGTISDSPRAVRQFLTKNRRQFLRQLERVAGKVEMGLRVTWEVPNIFEYFVNMHPDLRELRDRLLSATRPPNQDDKIELGQMFARLLEEERARLGEKVERAVSTACFECKPNKCRTEREVMNLACLVARDRQEDFAAAVFQAAQLFDNDFAFDYNGPWAPHNFVDVEVEL